VDDEDRHSEINLFVNVSHASLCGGSWQASIGKPLGSGGWQILGGGKINVDSLLLEPQPCAHSLAHRMGEGGRQAE
jgi:hypothetical protein